MMFSYMNKSHYHEACVPTHQRRAVYAEPNTKPVAVLDYTNRTDAVKEDILWRQCVSKEEKAVSKWEDEWGFLVEYDSKGNAVTPEQLPEYQSRFASGPVPKTVAGVYGSRTHSTNTQNMLSLERALAAPNRKKKLDREMVCY